MKSQNFIPERTLRVLYGNHQGLPELPGERPFEDWCGDLLGPFRREWQQVPVIPIRTTTYSGPILLEFNYDRTRLNPYHLQENFSRAMQLLDECYALKDTYKDYEVQILNEEAMFDMFEKQQAIATAELELMRKNLYSVFNAQTLVSGQEDGKNTLKGKPEDVLPGESEELAIELKKQKMALEKEDMDRLKKASTDLGSPYNKHGVVARLKAKYAHRFTELVMHVEVIKHGLLILNGKKPGVFTITEEDLNDAIDAYRHFPQLQNSMQLKAATDTTEELTNTQHAEPETLIRTYLWEVSETLQREHLVTDEYIHRLSVKHILPEEVVWKDVVETGMITFNLEEIRLPTRGKLLGISVEPVLKSGKKITKLHDADKVYDIEHTHETEKDTLFHFSVSLPLQYLGDTEDYETHDHKDIHLSVTPTIRAQSAAMLNTGTPTFYGTNILMNFTPVGHWTLNYTLTPRISNLNTVLDNIYLYLHLKTTL